MIENYHNKMKEENNDDIININNKEQINIQEREIIYDLLNNPELLENYTPRPYIFEENNKYITVHSLIGPGSPTYRLALCYNAFKKYSPPVFALILIAYALADEIIQIKYKYFDVFNFIPDLLITALSVIFFIFIFKGKDIKNRCLAIITSLIIIAEFCLRLTGFIILLLDKEKKAVPIQELMIAYLGGEMISILFLAFLTC